jgi:hypothetical protein
MTEPMIETTEGELLADFTDELSDEALDRAPAFSCGQPCWGRVDER